MGSGCTERGDPSGRSAFVWNEPDDATEGSVATSAAERKRWDGDAIDMEFEWLQVCHGCGERTRFRGLICDDCRERHDV
jgi:hypothetical protein